MTYDYLKSIIKAFASRFIFRLLLSVMMPISG